MESSRPKDGTVNRGGGSWQTEIRPALLADFTFQIKARATSGNKDVSDRMRKWNVYSKGADKWGRWRRWRALVRTVAFTYGRAATNIKWWEMSSCALLSVIYPIYTSTKPLQFPFGTALWSAIWFVFSNSIVFCVAFRWFPLHSKKKKKKKQDWKYSCLHEKYFTYRLILLGLNNMLYCFSLK